MSTAAAIAEALGARTSTGMRGTNLTFQRGDHWHTLTVREQPHLELSLPAPGLVGLTLDVQCGDATILGGDARAVDRRWRLRSNDGPRALALFDEVPWPEGERHRTPLDLRVVAASAGVIGLTVMTPAFGIFLGVVLAERERRRRGPSGGRYILTVERELATLEQRTGDATPEVAIGMARRLLQLVTRPTRREAEIASPTPRNPEGNAPYR